MSTFGKKFDSNLSTGSSTFSITGTDKRTASHLKCGESVMYRILAVPAKNKKRDNAVGATRRSPLGRVSTINHRIQSQ